MLISTKIISLLVHSPIIFLGYSLTDLNVRKIIQDFSTSLTSSEIKRMSSRIIIVDRVEGMQELLERTVYDKELGCEYTVIQTDNFTELYEKTVQINQGVSPSEVRRFQQVIKKLIVDSGKKGSLNTLLIAPEQLEELEKRIGDEKLVVALGDATYIFRTPDLISYVEDYIFNKNEIPTEIALRYVASQGNTAKIPFFRHVETI